MEGGIAGVGEGEGAREGITVEANGTEVGVIVCRRSGVAIGDGEAIARERDLGLGEFDLKLQNGGVADVHRRGCGVIVGEQALEPAWLAGQGFGEGKIP